MKKILILATFVGSFSLLAQVVDRNDVPGSKSCSGIISTQMAELMMQSEELNKVTLESLENPSAARKLGEVMGAFHASQSAVSSFCKILEELKK